MVQGGGDIVLRYFFSKALVATLLAVQNCLGNFGRGHCQEFGPEVQGEMLFKEISYLELWWQNYSENVGRGPYVEHFCGTI